jgi:hypothetical protein
MKQLTIYCSRDLEERVVHVLDHAGVEAFFRSSTGTGVRFLPQGQLPRTMTWEALFFLVPAIEEPALEQVIDELQRYSGSCEIEPCLRIVVSTVDRVL